MPDTTNLILIRHGETVDNVARRTQGQLPGRLNEVGIAQARAAARRLQQADIAALYSSDSERAHHTARFIAAVSNRTIIQDARLRERHYGVMQGHLHAEFDERFPTIMASHRSRDPDYTIPGGESYRDLYHRVISCTEEIAKRHPGETVAIITHGGALGALLRYVLGIPLDQPRHFWVRNASLNLFHYEREQWRLETWGDVSHLQSLDSHVL